MLLVAPLNYYQTKSVRIELKDVQMTVPKSEKHVKKIGLKTGDDGMEQ